MRPVITAGLTPAQRQQVADVLRRVGHVPLGTVGSLFADIDVVAACVLNASRPSQEDCAAALARAAAREHQLDELTASFVVGYAIGLRQGRTFAPPPTPRAKHWISEEYRGLTEEHRRAVAGIVRMLLRLQGGPRPLSRRTAARPIVDGLPPAPSPASDDAVAVAKRWTQQMGKAARHLR